MLPSPLACDFCPLSISEFKTLSTCVEMDVPAFLLPPASASILQLRGAAASTLSAVFLFETAPVQIFVHYIQIFGQQHIQL